MAHTSLGWGRFLTGDWENWEGELQRAIALSPGYATGHNWYGVSLFSTGRATEAVIHAERAMELDPVSHVISRSLGWALAAAGRTQEATEQHRETTELAPGWPQGWMSLSRGLLEVDEGREAWVNAARLANLDVQATREAYEAVIDYRETGEPQTFPDFEGGGVDDLAVCPKRTTRPRHRDA